MPARRVVTLAFAAATVLGLVYVAYGRMHVDESYYLYAAKLVSRGQMPYRDFFFLQNPAQPYVYGLGISLWSSPYMGRLVSLGFTLAGLAAGAGAARRLGGDGAAALATVLIGLNGFHTYFVSIVRVYAPATALLLVAAWLYVRLPGRTAAAAAAGAAMGLAIDFRLTVAPALGALVAALCLRREWRTAAAAALSGTAAVAVPFLPFVIAAPGRLWFQLVGFHSEIRVAGGVRELVLFKFKAIPRLANGYFLFWAMLLLLLALLWRAEGRGVVARLLRSLGPAGDREGDLWVVGLATFLAHMAPMFVQASYFVVAMPILMVLVAVALARRLPPLHGPAAALVLALGLLQVLAYGKSSLAPDGRLRGPFARLAPHVEYLRSVTTPDDEILTSDSQIVPFLADRRILHGYESFEYFPSWSTAKCHEYGVVNDEILLAHLRSRRPAAVLINELSYMKPFPTSIDTGPEARDRILAALAEGYELGATFPGPFGPTMTSQVWVRRGTEATPAAEGDPAGPGTVPAAR